MKQTQVSAPRVPKAVLQVLHTKRGGAMKTAKSPNRAKQKHSFRKESSAFYS